MDDVVLALEGAIAPMECFIDDRDGPRRVLARDRRRSTARPSCSGPACRWASIRSLQRTTLAELVEFGRPHEGARGISGRADLALTD